MPNKFKKNHRRGGKINYNIRGPRSIKSESLAFPDRSLVALKYYDFRILAGGLNQSWGYNLNSLFDPDATGTGHQPYAYDQWSQFYGRYLVRRCRVRVLFAQSNDTSDTIVICGALNGFSGGTLTQLQAQDLAESPFSKSDLLDRGSGQVRREMTFNFDLAKISGATRVKYAADDRYAALISANPAEAIGFFINCFDFAGATVNVAFTVEIMYHAEMFDRNFPTQSLALVISKPVSSSSSSVTSMSKASSYLQRMREREAFKKNLTNVNKSAAQLADVIDDAEFVFDDGLGTQSL